MTLTASLVAALFLFSSPFSRAVQRERPQRNSVEAGTSATATPTPSERPTFAQAFAADATPAAESQTATPSTDTSTTDPSAATTTQPVSSTTTEGAITPDGSKGEPPKERWDDILKNARTKAAAEKQAEFDRDFGWAKQVPRETIQEWTGIAQRMSSDPIGFLNELQAEIASHPVFGPQLRSHAARTLAAGRSEKPLEPDIDVDVGDGRVIKAYSPERAIELARQIARDELAKEVAPLKQDFQSRQQQQKADAERHAIDTKVNSTYERVSKRDGYKEHEAEIATALEALPNDMDPGEALYEAYLQVVGPKLEARAQAKHLESLKTKAAAATVNPATPATSTTKRPTSFHDPALKWG